MSTPPQPNMPNPSDPTIILPPPSPMDPVVPLIVAILAGFLGLAGVAYFLYGQWQKGVGYLVLTVALAVLTFVTCGLASFAYVPLWIIVAIDAYLQSKLLRDGHPIRQWSFFTRPA